MKTSKLAIKITILITTGLLLLSCNPIEKDTQSASMLLIESISGTDMEGNTVDYLQSDVLYVSPDTGAESIIADSATVTLRAKLLDPSSITGPSQYNDIQLTRYVVSYSRTDGKNREGIDVPYSFEGSLSKLIKVETSTVVSFVIVREVSKAEPPLVNLREGRGEGVLQVTAKVEFYGHDLAERNVKTTGYITIYFANYVN